MQTSRFMGADAFVRELKELKAFGNSYVDTGLLERMESANLLRPRIRVRYPDSIARRVWQESNETITIQMTQPVEPDGPRWEAAADLWNALSRWNISHGYRLDPHPLDDPEPRFIQFVQGTSEVTFERRLKRRVQIGMIDGEPLFSDCNIENFYSSWQILFAAEMADAGIHIHLNLADCDLERLVEDLRQGRFPENATYSLNFRAVHAARDFAKHEAALDVAVWYGEELNRMLSVIAMEHGGRRFRLTDTQRNRYNHAHHDIAKAALSRFGCNLNDLMALIRFLAEYWARWNSEGRPLIAGAYKVLLGHAVKVTLADQDLTFEQLSDRIGRVYGPIRPILDVIWPNWLGNEKERAFLTLRGSTGLEKPGKFIVGDDAIKEFVDFLADSRLESFFWRLRSFEEHDLRGNEFRLAGMQSDVQAMAVIVEHVAEALRGRKVQLYEKFKELWRGNSAVLELLKRDKVQKLATNGRWIKDWSGFKTEVNLLRGETGGEIVADLVVAHRVRGGVHSGLPETDHLELEALFVCLMRAALRTFVESRTATTGP